MSLCTCIFSICLSSHLLTSHENVYNIDNNENGGVKREKCSRGYSNMRAILFRDHTLILSNPSLMELW